MKRVKVKQYAMGSNIDRDKILLFMLGVSTYGANVLTAATNAKTINKLNIIIIWNEMFYCITKVVFNNKH